MGKFEHTENEHESKHDGSFPAQPRQGSLPKGLMGVELQRRVESAEELRCIGSKKDSKEKNEKLYANRPGSGRDKIGGQNCRP